MKKKLAKQEQNEKMMRDLAAAQGGAALDECPGGAPGTGSAACPGASAGCGKGDTQE